MLGFFFHLWYKSVPCDYLLTSSLWKHHCLWWQFSFSGYLLTRNKIHRQWYDSNFDFSRLFPVRSRLGSHYPAFGSASFQWFLFLISISLILAFSFKIEPPLSCFSRCKQSLLPMTHSISHIHLTISALWSPFFKPTDNLYFGTLLFQTNKHTFIVGTCLTDRISNKQQFPLYLSHIKIKKIPHLHLGLFLWVPIIRNFINIIKFLFEIYKYLIWLTLIYILYYIL